MTEKSSKIKICWRGIIDEAIECNWGGRHWESNVPQEVLRREDSEKQKKDGWIIEESHPDVAPDGRRILVTKSRWLSMHEAALAHPCFDVEGEEPKPMKKRPKPTRYPNAAEESADNPWVGTNA